MARIRNVLEHTRVSVAAGHKGASYAKKQTQMTIPGNLSVKRRDATTWITDEDRTAE